MPTYTDPTTGKKIRSEVELTPDELEESFELAGEASQETTPQPQATTQPTKSVGGFIGNVGANAGNIVKGLYNMVAHPGNTYKGIESFVKGGVAALEPYTGIPWDKNKSASPSDIAAFAPVKESIVRTIKDPRSVPGRLLDYAYSNPLDMALMASQGLGMAGKAVKATQPYALAQRYNNLGIATSGLPKTASTIARGLEIGETVTNPLLLPRNISKGIIELIPESLERSMMKRSMKPSTTLKDTERFNRLETALNEGIPATKKGLEKSTGVINEINTEIQQRIDDFTRQGLTVNKQNILQPAENMKNAEMPKLAFPEKPTRQIEKVIDEFKQQPDDLTLRQAQDFKQSINKELDDFYKALSYSPDKTATITKAWTNRTKAKIAEGLREEISNVFPEIRDLNKREASLIQLNKSLERAVNRISQHNRLSLGGMIGLVVHPKYAFLNYVMNDPALQSNLAVVLRKARSKPFVQTGQTTKRLIGITGSINSDDQNQ